MQWTFEGKYQEWIGTAQAQMFDPILIDLDGDALLDVVVIYFDRTVYGIHGEDGIQLFEHFSYIPPPYEAIHLTFVPEGDLGILLYASQRRGYVDTLNALVIAERVSE